MIKQGVASPRLVTPCFVITAWACDPLFHYYVIITYFYIISISFFFVITMSVMGHNVD